MLRPLDPQTRMAWEEATRAYEAAFPGSPAEEYVLAVRQLDPDIVAAARIGYADPETVMPGLERFQNHVVIPYLAADGHVTRLKFRSLDPEAVVRYGQPSGLALKMYNVQALTRAGDVIAITEGEFDALALESVGIPAVGLPGASSWKTHMGHLLDGFSRVVLCKDNDADDESKTDQLEAAIRRDFPDLPLVSIHPPRGLKDMNDMLTAGLDGDMRRLVMGR